MPMRKSTLFQSALISPFATIQGTPGPDELQALADGDVVHGLGGDDFLSSGYNFTTLYGGDGQDRLNSDNDYTVEGDSTATFREAQFGDAGNDWLFARVTMFDARDSFLDIDVEVRQSGGLGNDVMQTSIRAADLSTGILSALLFGGDGDDRMTSEMNTDQVGGGPVVFARLYGGDGVDRISATTHADSITIPATAHNLIWGDAGDDEIFAFADANGDGGIATNEIRGGSGDDWVRAVTDVVTNVGSNTQYNTIWGGTGNDVIEAGHDFGSNGGGWSENIIQGGGGDDNVRAWIQQKPYAEQYGLIALNDIAGESGNDLLSARIDVRASSDFTLDNRLSGGSGADRLRAEITVDFYRSDPGVVVIARNTLRGGSGDDSLTVVGGFVNLLDGGDGADRMTGGTGDDTYVVNTARDVTVEAPGASGGTDTVRAWVNHRLAAGIENLTLLASVRGVGNDGDNVLTGNGGANRLVGLAGADRLIGGGGTDLLEGGAGADAFVLDLRPGRTGVLTLSDFSRTADRFEIAGLADAGAPGLRDDLDALADFDDAGPGGLLEVTLGGIVLRLPGRGTGAVDSFADIVANPATQLVAADDLFA